MITYSFIFIPGIGKKVEEELWREGILTWEDLKVASLPVLNKIKRKVIETYLELAELALKELNASFFARYLPKAEYWRVYKEFHPKTLFLDIETTGLSLYYDVITLICAFDPYKNRIKLFLRNENLEEIKSYLKEYEVIVTFNGKKFDIPFLQKEFPDIKLPPIHIDLKCLLRSLGFSGSLKDIEARLGFKRENGVQDIDGRKAVVLWSRFIKGDNEALKMLLLYNIYDTIVLEKLMQFAYITKIEKDILPKVKGSFLQQLLFRTIDRKEFDYYIPSFGTTSPMVDLKPNDRFLIVYINNEKVLKIDMDMVKKRSDIKIHTLIKSIKSRGYKPLVVGIDLTGAEKRASGVCILQEDKAVLALLKTDEEIISTVLRSKPTIVSIDSPLSLPKGRCCISDSCECRRYGITRECERILKKRGINVYPCLIKSMQNLTARGIKLAKIFKEYGYQVIESYPGAAQDILGFPRKRIDLKELEADLKNMGIIVYSDKRTVTHDEIDALTSALVGYFYLAGIYEAIGNPEEGYLIIPDLKKWR